METTITIEASTLSKLDFEGAAVTRLRIVGQHYRGIAAIEDDAFDNCAQTLTHLIVENLSSHSLGAAFNKLCSLRSLSLHGARNYNLECTDVPVLSRLVHFVAISSGIWSLHSTVNILKRMRRLRSLAFDIEEEEDVECEQVQDDDDQDDQDGHSGASSSSSSSSASSSSVLQTRERSYSDGAAAPSTTIHDSDDDDNSFSSSSSSSSDDEDFAARDDDDLDANVDALRARLYDSMRELMTLEGLPPNFREVLANAGFTEAHFARAVSGVHRRAEVRRSSPICTRNEYRAFLVTELPSLTSLDGVEVAREERLAARAKYRRRFVLPPPPPPMGVARALALRERGSATRRNATHVAASSRLATASHMGGGIRRPASRVLVPDAWHRRAYRPRQFEYHPLLEHRCVYGTCSGLVVVDDPHRAMSDRCFDDNDDERERENGSDSAPYAVASAAADEGREDVLALNWLRQSAHQDFFLCGTDVGTIRMMCVRRMACKRNPVLYEFEPFENLTSVVVNSADELALASGYSRDLNLYDVRTGALLERLANVHADRINVVKFAAHNPNLFVSSSFDRTAKLWDLRERSRSRPLRTMEGSKTNGLMMACFSFDDRYVLTSAINNEVKMFSTQSGELVVDYDIEQRRSNRNYTRSYFMHGIGQGDASSLVIVGSCAEPLVHVYSAVSGQFLVDVDLRAHLPYAQRQGIYCLSLRGDPHVPLSFTALASAQTQAHSHLVQYNLMQ
jgi:WD domain, G-beta repeat